MTSERPFSPLRWHSGCLSLIDQRRLPAEELWIECRTAAEVHAAIRDMVVRGAPAIGCAAAYGVALAALRGVRQADTSSALLAVVNDACAMLATARPTAINLFWALDEMRSHAAAITGDGQALAAALEQRARAIHADDIDRCQRIGAHGAALIQDGATVLTHCNAGALATGGYGTALGVLRAMRARGDTLRVIADETRPYLQGARLTAWELQREGFDVTVIPDSAAAALLQRGEISCCVVGADRIAANGDAANKIGTYGVALAAHAAGVPFYVAAPLSTLDMATARGADIPIEERDGREMFTFGDAVIVPAGVAARYPAFDVTPASLITAIITECGAVRPPYTESLAALVRAAKGSSA